MNSSDVLGEDGVVGDNKDITDFMNADENLKRRTIGALSADGYLLCVHKSTFSSEISKLVLISGGGCAQGDVGLLASELGITLPDSFPARPFVVSPEILEGQECIPKLQPSFYMPYSPVLYGASHTLTDPIQINKTKATSENNHRVDTSLGYMADNTVMDDINNCISNIVGSETHFGDLKPTNLVSMEEMSEVFALFENIPEDDRSEYLIYVIGTPVAYASIALQDASTYIGKPISVSVGSFVRELETNYKTAIAKQCSYPSFAMPIHSPASIQSVCSDTQKKLIVECLSMGGSTGNNMDKILIDNYCNDLRPFPRVKFLEYACASQLCQLFPYDVKISLVHFLKIIRFVSQMKRAPSTTEKDLKTKWVAQNKIRSESGIELLTINVLFDLYRSFETVDTSLGIGNVPHQYAYIKDFVASCMDQLHGETNLVSVQWVALTEYDSRQNVAIRSLLDKYSCIRNRSYVIKDNRQQKTGVATSTDVMKHCYIEPSFKNQQLSVKNQIILALSVDIFAYASVISQMHREVRLGYIEAVKDLNETLSTFRLSSLEHDGYRPSCTCDVTVETNCACKIIREWCKFANCPNDDFVAPKKVSKNSSQINYKDNTLLSTFKIRMRDTTISTFADAQKTPDNLGNSVSDEDGAETFDSKKKLFVKKRLSTLLTNIAKTCKTGMESNDKSYFDRIPLQKEALLNELCTIDYNKLCEVPCNSFIPCGVDDNGNPNKRRKVQKSPNYKLLVDSIIHDHVEKWVKYWNDVSNVVRESFHVDKSSDFCFSEALGEKWNYRIKATLNLDQYTGLYKNLFISSIRYFIANVTLIEVKVGSLKNEHLEMKFPLPNNRDLFMKIMSCDLGIKTKSVHLNTIREMHFFGKGTRASETNNIINLRECSNEVSHMCPVMVVKGSSKMDESLRYQKNNGKLEERRAYLLRIINEGFKIDTSYSKEYEPFYEKYTEEQMREETQTLDKISTMYPIPDNQSCNFKNLFLSHTYKAVMRGISNTVGGASVHSASSEKIRLYIQNESAQPHLFYFIKCLEILCEMYSPQGFKFSEGNGYLSDMKHLFAYMGALRVLRYTMINHKAACIFTLICSTSENDPFNILSTHRLDLWHRGDNPYMSFPSNIHFYPPKNNNPDNSVMKYYGGLNMGRVSCEKSYIIESIKEDAHRIKKYTRVVDMPFVVIVSPNLRTVHDDKESEISQGEFNIPSIILQGKSGHVVEIDIIRKILPRKLGFENVADMLRLCPTVDEVLPVISRGFDISTNDAHELINILYQQEYNMGGKDILQTIDFFATDQYQCDSDDNCLLDE